MELQSLWSETVQIEEREPLRGDIEVNTAIIGAGMAGILTGCLLKWQGVDAVILEADRIAGGQTKNTTAKITSQHGMIYSKMTKKLGRKKAEMYAKANENAIEAYSKIVRDKKIECHFQRVSSYLYSTDRVDSLMSEAQEAASLGIKAYFTRTCDLPFPIAGAVCFENQASFNPLEFIKALAEEIVIYEKTKVLSVKGHKIITDKGVVTAKNIVFATHYPFINIPGFYFLRQHQERSYIIALENAGKLDGIYYSIDSEGLSFRSSGDKILIGGGSHRTGENTQGGSYDKLRQAAQRYYHQPREIAHWSAQDCMPHDDVPFIGKFSIFRPYWYTATGFKKWGMTGSMISAMIISSNICGIKVPEEEVFKPQRFYLRASSANLVKDIGKSVKGLLKGFFYIPRTKESDIQEGCGAVVRKGIHKYGVFKDETGSIHRISVRCPHMGCQLQWSPEEKCWECPCHGSRYDCDGKLIDNPAQVDKKSENTQA